QLVFDDTDNQQRAALHSTQYASQLNLGHLIHQADNYRGSFRGTGVELRTDAWGALRAARGITLTTWAQQTDAEPAGDMAPAAALLGQADTLAQTLSKAAATHQTVPLAAAIGSSGANQSTIDPNAAPLKALHTAARGMADGTDFDAALADASQKNTATAGKLPHLTDAAIVQAAKAGLGLVAGGHLQLSNGETLNLMSGEDTNLAVAGKARIHTGQAIGLLAGAIRPGENGAGITMIAAKDDIEMQAQSDEMKFQAKDEVTLSSITEHIDFAAGKRIVLAVEGGASITIDGGITVECPGTITVHASQKSFSGPVRESYELPDFPDDMTNPLKRKMRFALGALPEAMVNYAGEPYRLLADGKLLNKGVADDSGTVAWEHIEGTTEYAIELMTGATFTVKAHDQFADDATQRELQMLSNRGYRSHEHSSDVPATLDAVGDAFRKTAAGQDGASDRKKNHGTD
ncbi:type VI secretion system Vgr family protein, partial [Denitromonas iodatirespirans]